MTLMRMMTIMMTTMMIILSNNLAMCCRCWNSSHTADHHHHRCSQHNSKAQAEEKLCRKNRGKSPKDWFPVWKSPWRHLADPWSHRLNHPAATANHSYQKSILQFVQVGTRILPFFGQHLEEETRPSEMEVYHRDTRNITIHKWPNEMIWTKGMMRTS